MNINDYELEFIEESFIGLCVLKVFYYLFLGVGKEGSILIFAFRGIRAN